MPLQARQPDGDPGPGLRGGGLPEQVPRAQLTRPRRRARHRARDRDRGGGRSRAAAPGARPRALRGGGLQPRSRHVVRGPETGVTLARPHGQVCACPFITPRTPRMPGAVRACRGRTGRDLADDTLAAERAGASRIVAAGRHRTAFVPFAARWPYEVHLHPARRVPDLTALTGPERDEFCQLYPGILRRLDRLLGATARYRDLAPGPGPRRPPRTGPAPGTVHHQARPRKAQAPRRHRIRHGRLHQRHHPRRRSDTTPRTRIRPGQVPTWCTMSDSGDGGSQPIVSAATGDRLCRVGVDAG